MPHGGPLENDVIGCGYDQKTRSIFFTFQGKIVTENTIRYVPLAQYFPFIHFDDNSISVQVNFNGPFKYELPEAEGFPSLCKDMQILRLSTKLTVVR
jgi:hypothetical protein